MASETGDGRGESAPAGAKSAAAGEPEAEGKQLVDSVFSPRVATSSSSGATIAGIPLDGYELPLELWIKILDNVENSG